MTLKRLDIQLEQWGINKGRYEVTIEVQENGNEIKLVLPPEMGTAIVGQCQDLIHKFSVRAADRLRDELALATPPMLEDLKP